MTLLKIFNNALKEIPILANSLENLIRNNQWPKKKKEQAIEIVSQLKYAEVVRQNLCGYEYVSFKRLQIKLTPSQCGIKNADKFNSESVLQSIEYMKKLIAELNNISEDIKFRLSGKENIDESNHLFFIDWEF